MVDIDSFLGAMKLSWIRRVWNNADLRNFVCNLIPNITEMKNLGGEFANVVMGENENLFWKDVCKHYKRLHCKCKIQNLDDFLAEHIYYNLNIIQGKKNSYDEILVQGWYKQNSSLD